MSLLKPISIFLYSNIWENSPNFKTGKGWKWAIVLKRARKWTINIWKEKFNLQSWIAESSNKKKRCGFCLIKLRKDILQQCFSNFNVCSNRQGLLFKRRSWFWKQRTKHSAFSHSLLMMPMFLTWGHTLNTQVICNHMMNIGENSCMSHETAVNQRNLLGK